MENVAQRHPAASMWRRVALPASLVLNLFLAALVGGHMLRGQLGGAGGLPLAQALANAESLLSSKDAAAFDAVLRKDAPTYIGAARQLQEARGNLSRQIAATPYDKQAVRQSLVQWQVQWNRFVDSFSASLIEALGEVSATGRQKLVNAHQQTPFIPHTKQE